MKTKTGVCAGCENQGLCLFWSGNGKKYLFEENNCGGEFKIEKAKREDFKKIL